MKNPYIIPKNNEYLVSDSIITAILPFAPISQGIDTDRNVLRPKNASLKERLKNCSITIVAEMAQLAIYYNVYGIYSNIHEVLR